MSIPDIVLLAAVGAALIGALVAVRRGKTGGCSGDCTSCHHSCTEKKDKK